MIMLRGALLSRSIGRRLAPPVSTMGTQQVRTSTSAQRDDHVDPLSLVADQLAHITARLKETVSSDIPPNLAAAAHYFFNMGVEGKRFRPMVLLLMSSSLSMDMSTGHELWKLPVITEMIHVASLMHDDVLDHADSRRGAASLNLVVGNRMAVRAGKLLLGKATGTLSRLMNHEVTSLMSQGIRHLVSGEAMQMGADERSCCSMDYYLTKTFYKTASLIANSCKSVAVLGGYPEQVTTAAFEYGRHLGMAYQIVDDLLDFTGTRASLGKPVLSDLREGLATAPVLFALDEHRELQPLIERKFKHPGDVEAALAMVLDSNGITRTKELAREHARKAAAAIAAFPPTSLERANLCRRGLTKLAEQALDRQK